jgi:NTE family protein
MFYKYLLCWIILAKSIFLGLNAQTVGLVLSGGGAKGIAHISVIRALEENGIPIDYITGTSMGAIVGGLYASGYNPDDMIDILKSEDFRYWSTGQIPKRYYYFYKERYPNSAMFNFQFSRRDSITRFRPPVSLIPPHSMDLGLLELFSRAGGKAGQNFDSLFVPFRCVASDIFKGEAVVFSQGELPSAIRASMTYPFYFQPIEIDDVLYFDGGIYNNFPFDVMIKDFNPDIIIGVKVSGGKEPPGEDNLVQQIENMVLGHTNYHLPAENGILIEIELGDISLMDFEKHEDILDRSVPVIESFIDSIKMRIPRKEEYFDLIEKRNRFNKDLPYLRFNEVSVKGLNEKQTEYVIKSIQYKEGELFGIEQLRNQYFLLVTDDKISRIYPRAIYNSETGFFDLFLDIRSTSVFDSYLGGNISSSAINQGFAGFDYKYLNRQSYNLEGNVYFGRLYSSVLLRGRMEYPGQVPVFVDASASLSRLDYFSSSNDLFFEDVRPSYLIQNERSYKFTTGLPVSVNRFVKFGYSAGRTTDRYYQVKSFNKSDTADVTHLDLNVLMLGTERNTTNFLQYPTRGVRYVFSGSYIAGKENYIPGSTSLSGEIKDRKYKWLEAGVTYEHYFKIAKNYSFGLHFEGRYSNRNFLSNYTSTILDAFAFQPTPHSKTLFIHNYRANNYVAAGIKPLVKFNDIVHWRNELYMFVPHKPIFMNRADQTAFYGKSFSQYHLMASTAIVAQTLFGPLSVSLNYYDKDDKKFYLIFNFGYILFNPKIRN